MALVDNVYLIEDKHTHSSVKKEYLHVKKITGKNLTFKVLFCDICKKYMCPVDIYNSKYKGLINDKLFIEPNENTFINDTSFIADSLEGKCLNDITSFCKEHLQHCICERIILYKGIKLNLAYCKDCDAYGIEKEYINNILVNKDLNESYTKLNINPENNLSDSIEFLIKINSFRCNTRKHDIEDIIAIVNVFDKKNNEVKKIEVSAFYCRDCKLYFIFENEYNKILNNGIPICPIHEELKYFNKTNSFDSYNTESMLRQFGYNVSAQEDLSTSERHKIIEFILNNGFMTKNEILSHLTFLSNSRKNQPNMLVAVSKWNDDIAFVNTFKNANNRVIKVGAFRKYIRK